MTDCTSDDRRQTTEGTESCLAQRRKVAKKSRLAQEKSKAAGKALKAPLRVRGAPFRAIRIGIKKGVAGRHGLPAHLQVLGEDAGPDLGVAVIADACARPRPFVAARSECSAACDAREQNAEKNENQGLLPHGLLSNTGTNHCDEICRVSLCSTRPTGCLILVIA
jgi:hypothetical protein